MLCAILSDILTFNAYCFFAGGDFENICSEIFTKFIFFFHFIFCFSLSCVEWWRQRKMWLKLPEINVRIRCDREILTLCMRNRYGPQMPNRIGENSIDKINLKLRASPQRQIPLKMVSKFPFRQSIRFQAIYAFKMSSIVCVCVWCGYGKRRIFHVKWNKSNNGNLTEYTQRTRMTKDPITNC